MVAKISIIQDLGSAWVIDKPVGLSVHNAEAGQNQTDLLQVFAAQMMLATAPLPVNRLDKETSGLMVLAKDSKTAATLAMALGQPECEKNYVAILRGHLKNTNGTTELTWNWPISDKSEGRQNPQGKSADRVMAQTNVRIEKQNKFFTEVHLVLETGRQHQIRKHAAIAKHAIVGDSRYGEAKYNSMIANRYKTNRMMLHAGKLKFQFQGQLIESESPTPTEFLKMFETTSEE